MSKIRIGIVGVGIIGKSHLDAYAKIPDVEIVAACDIDTPELNRVCDKHNIKNRYEKFRDLLKRDDLDAVDVALHNNLHAPVTIEALRSGKHVYCEKPIAGSYFDGKAMIEEAKKCGKMLHIQLAFLYTRETKIAKRLIEAGRLGHIYHARSTGFRRRGRPYVDGYATPQFVNTTTSGGGALYDMGVYHISQLLYLLGMPKVQRVTGRVYQETGMDETRRKLSNYNVEELGTGYVRFADNLTMDIIESWAIHMNAFEGSVIAGSKGGVRLAPLSYHTTTEDVETNMTFEDIAADSRWHSLNSAVSYYDSSQHHWVAALQGKVELLPTAQIALQTMLISQGIYLSEKLGREVTVEEIEQAAVTTALKL